MNEYKIAFWGLMLAAYVGLFWIGPLCVEPSTDYMLTVFACHVMIVSILAFAWLVGHLYDKAYGY